jgi:hypothetical protein
MTEHDDHSDTTLDSVLRAGAPAVPQFDTASLSRRIRDGAEFALAARRRDGARSAADTLARWFRYAVPLATAAAVIAMLSVSKFDRSTATDEGSPESDPTALWQSLHDASGESLALHLISSDVALAMSAEGER